MRRVTQDMGQKRDSSPCVDCDRNDGRCEYLRCKAYRRWLNRQWNGFRRWPVQQPQEAPRDGVWRYDPPYLVRDYLRQGCCPTCPARVVCREKLFCPTWRQWIYDRLLVAGREGT